MTRTRLSSKGQVVIPKEVRDRLALRPGDELVVEIQADSIILRKPPRSWARWGYGLGRHVWKGVDTDEYLSRERETWERKLP